MKKTLLSLGLVLSLFTTSQAQTPNQAVPLTDALQNQFSSLHRKASNYRVHNRDYKVIEVKQLHAFWDGVLGTVKNHENELLKGGNNSREALQQANRTIAAQTNQIAALKRDNALKDKAVQNNAYEVDHIPVLGLGINKQFFVLFSLTMIIGLSVLALVIMSLYKKSKKITEEKIRAFQEIDNEFNEYKKAARERELKVKRELQTEMNRKDELKQQLALLQK